MTREAFCFIACICFLPPLDAACTATVTNPVATSTVSGLINLTMTYSGCPSAYQAVYQLDDFYTIANALGPVYTYNNWSTGVPSDGIFNIRVLLYDVTGTIIATSADVNFKINNFGLGSTLSVTSPANFFSQPTVSGTITFSVATTYTPTSNLQNLAWIVDGYQFTGAAGWTTSKTFDTTQLPNGLHLFAMKIDCLDTGSCGTLNNVSMGTTLYRGFLGAMLNVQNSSVASAVKPSVYELELAVGDSPYSFDATMLKTDGTTSGSTFTLAMEHACLVGDPQATELPSRCTSGNSFDQITNMEGGPWISLSSTTLTTGTPITITPLGMGHSLIKVTDNSTGKFVIVQVGVRDTRAVRHLGTCGASYSSYTPEGNCPSIVRTAIENAPTSSSLFLAGTKKVGNTAFEMQFWLDPGAGNTANYANFNAWKTAWTNNYGTPINNLIANLPGFCIVLRGETLTQTTQSLIEGQFGWSANGWSTEPLPNVLGVLAATNKICGMDARDEAQNGYDTFNNVFNAKFSDSSISKIVVKGGEAMVYPPTSTGTYPHDFVYGAQFRWGLAISLQNATSAGFNTNSAPMHCLYHSLFNTTIEANGSFSNNLKSITNVTTGATTTITTNGNLSVTWPGNSSVCVYGVTGNLGAAINGCVLPNSISGPTVVLPINSTGLTGSFASSQITPGPCTDPNTHAVVEDTFTFATSAADGTYTPATDPNLEILGWGPNYKGYSYDGSIPMPNNAFDYVHQKFKAAGLPLTWPVSGAADIIHHIYFNRPNNSEYTITYLAYPIVTSTPAFRWGLEGVQIYNGIYAAKWGMGEGGYYKGQGTNTGYWQQEHAGWVHHSQTLPKGLLYAIMNNSFVMGGISIPISTISGATLTSSSPHGISAPGGGWMNYIKCTISGASDGTMNGHWQALPTGASTLKLYKPIISTGCAPSGALGTATVRGVSHTIQAGYTVTTIQPDAFPTDMVPGEAVHISGGGAACATNNDYAFDGWNSYPPTESPSGAYCCAELTSFANSAGSSGGTAICNASQGDADWLHDYITLPTQTSMFSANTVYSAAEGFSIHRIYAANDSGTQLGTFRGLFPQDTSNTYQNEPLVDPNGPANDYIAWMAGAPGLNLVKNRPSLFLQNMAASPWIAPGPPYVETAAQTSATYGNMLTVLNTSAISQTVSVPLGTYCQIGTNPISVYEMDWPHATSNLLTGAQTNYSLTMSPGEVDVFACHPNSSSLVKPVPFTFNPPAGTATTTVQVVYGNYPQPLAAYTRSFSGATSPVTLNLDTGWSDVWFRFQYLNSSNIVIGSSDFQKIPQH